MNITRRLFKLIDHITPERSRRLQHRLRRARRPATLGVLRSTEPLSDKWGYDRGTPIDRYYIEHFLQKHRSDVSGQVLEVHDSNYSRRFGSSVGQYAVLDVDSANLNATMTADLSAADSIDADQFDCFILTQTLHLIYDIRSAVTHAHRILRPGGVLLATVPAVSKIVTSYEHANDYWRFTPASCLTLFGRVFSPEQVTVCSYGNVLTAIAFLSGLAHEELTPKELDFLDEQFPVIVAVRAVKRVD